MEPTTKWGRPSDLSDITWMVDHVPGYYQTLTEKQKEKVDQYRHKEKVSRWKQRQVMKGFSGFREPFPGWFEGTDLFDEPHSP